MTFCGAAQGQPRGGPTVSSSSHRRLVQLSIYSHAVCFPQQSLGTARLTQIRFVLPFNYRRASSFKPGPSGRRPTALRFIVSITSATEVLDGPFVMGSGTGNSPSWRPARPSPITARISLRTKEKGLLEQKKILFRPVCLRTGLTCPARLVIKETGP